MSEQVQHFLYLFGVFYTELINQAGAALLGNYGTGNAAAGIQLLCQLGNALVFGLQNHAAVIKILAKAGNRVTTFGGMLIQSMTMFVVPVLQCWWRENAIKKEQKNKIQEEVTTYEI